MTKDEYADFVQRLTYHCRGLGTRDHFTANPLFVVQSLVRESGYDLDYTDNMCAYDHQNAITYWDPKDFYPEDEDDNLELQNRLNKMAQFYSGKNFLELTSSQQWGVLECFSDELTISGYQERWEYVSAHFTREAAEAFIRRKGHDYDELRIYVESQAYCNEFNAVKELILAGKLVYKQGVTQKCRNFLVTALKKLSPVFFWKSNP